MALGKKKVKQIPFWVETTQLQAHTQQPFYSRVNEILEKAKFDRYAERICRKYYAERMGRPSSHRERTSAASSSATWKGSIRSAGSPTAYRIRWGCGNSWV
jgi:hypothetical protein